MSPYFAALAAASVLSAPQVSAQPERIKAVMNAHDYVKDFNAARPDKQGRVTISCFIASAVQVFTVTVERLEDLAVLPE